MQRVKNFFYNLWTTPYPESIMNGLKVLFGWIPLPSKKLTTLQVLIRCLIIGTVSFVALLLLAGTINPIDILFDVPYFSVDEFVLSVSNHTSYTWTEYQVFSWLCIASILWLIHTFIFNKQEYSFFSLETVAYSIMAVVVALLIDFGCQNVFRAFHEAFITDYLLDPATFMTALFANFGLYFLLQNAFSTHLSFSITPFICKTFKLNLFGVGITQFIVVSMILKLILFVLEKIKVWDVIIGFIKKWIYTPKYIILIAWFPYFLIIALGLKCVFPEYYTKLKQKYLHKKALRQQASQQ